MTNQANFGFELLLEGVISDSSSPVNVGGFRPGFPGHDLRDLGRPRETFTQILDLFRYKYFFRNKWVISKKRGSIEMTH
jgi:hypothetical protein